MTKGEQARLTAWRLRVLQSTRETLPESAGGSEFRGNRSTNGSDGTPSTVTRG